MSTLGDLSDDELTLRRYHEGGGTIGSAIVRGAAALRKQHHDAEADDLENALHLLARIVGATEEVPQHLREGLDAYIETGRAVGSFLLAVLSNDLADAVARADPVSRRALPALVEYLKRPEVPASCHGSHDAVREWLSWSQAERAVVLRRLRDEMDDGGLQ